MSPSLTDESRFAFLDEDSNVLINGVPLTKGMLTYYNCDPLAKREFDLSKVAGAECYLSWLLINEEKLQGLRLQEYFARNNQLLASLTRNIQVGSLTLPAAFFAMWKYYDDLRRIDITDLKGVSTLVGALLDRSPFLNANAGLFNEFLSQIVPGAGIPLAIYAIYLTRPQYCNFIDLSKFEGRAILLGQALIDGELGRYATLDITNSFLDTHPNLKVSAVAYGLWRGRADLGAAFDLKSSESAAELEAWVAQYAKSEYPALAKLLNGRSNNLTGVQAIAWIPQGEVADVVQLREGINLVGFPFSVSGIGEDLRMLARVFDKLNVAFGVIETPNESPSDKKDSFSTDKVLQQPLYERTIFCLPCSEIFRFMAHYPRSYFAGQRLMAMMPWELPKWPDEHVEILKLFDEIWSYSKFIQKTIQKVSPCPVNLIRRYIEPPQQPQFDRRHFGIDEHAYVFLYVFDSLSALSRKNPFGAIEAFKKAFAGTSANVQLVLKTMKSTYDKNSTDLIAEISSSENIVLIDKTLSDGEVASLISVSDSYLSLHRAEGFGLTIANAMQAEKPVVVSSFSANLDFCTDQTSYLVDGKLVDVMPGQYFYTDGQQWFDADIDDAAMKLRQCFENVNGRSAELAKNGKRLIADLYGIESAKYSIGSQLEKSKSFNER